MSIDDDRVGMRHDGHEPDEAAGQRPKCIPVNPVHFPARLTNFSTAGSGRGSAQEFVQVDRHIVPVDVATTADFSRNILGQIVAPVLQRVESNHLDRVTELSRQKIGNNRLDVSALGFPSDAMLALDLPRPDRPSDRRHTAHSEEIRALPDLHVTEIQLQRRGKVPVTRRRFENACQEATTSAPAVAVQNCTSARDRARVSARCPWASSRHSARRQAPHCRSRRR